MGTLCRNLCTAAATFFLILSTTLIQEAISSESILDFNILSFENREGRVSSGGCCSVQQAADVSCPPCPVYLRICVQHYQVIVDPKGACTFAERETPLLDGNQINMTFNLNFSWPGEFSLIIDALHPSKREVDNNNVLVAKYIAQRSLSIGYNWTLDTFSSNYSSLQIMYRARCDTHYYGSRCQTVCRPRNDTFGHYSCSDDGEKVCNSGWSGSYCDKAVCLPGCQNGNCEKPNECNCRFGWQGKYCDTCVPYPGCRHGTCNEPLQCHCDEGWGGHQCDKDLNYCTNHKPCQNGGTCTNTGQGSFTCSCTDQYIGEKCHIPKNPCQSNPCNNGGTCENPSEGNYSCKCLNGFYGKNCETTAKICTSNPCENGGTCIHDPKGSICSCLPGYTGDWCEKEIIKRCSDHYCMNGGKCVSLKSGPHCNCPQGLTGDYCQTLVSCSSTTCMNGGTCIKKSSGFISCKCPAGFSGWNCKVNNLHCASNPCANGGECHNVSDGYRCECKKGYTGHDCLIKNFCSSSPCENGAFCEETVNNFSCKCLQGYHGIRCEFQGNSTDDLSRQSNVTKISQRVSSQNNTSQMSERQVALIASLSSILPTFSILLCCLAFCSLRLYRKRHCTDKPPKSKDLDFDLEDEQAQNERNAMYMNNKQCNIHQKISNTLDRLPVKVSNEAPPKVLNIDVGNKIQDKSLICASRTLQKKDNYSGNPNSHITQDQPLNAEAGIYVIEDHYRLCPEAKARLEIENVLATEV